MGNKELGSRDTGCTIYLFLAALLIVAGKKQVL